MNFFDGKQVRNKILAETKQRIESMDRKPVLAVFWIGDNEVSGHYVALKKKVAEDLGVDFRLIKFPESVTQEEVIKKINDVNDDKEVDGVMVQIPVPNHLDQKKIIEAISPEKDIDGLRYCLGLDSQFKPPVVLAILKAIEDSGKKIEESKIAVVGRGFLVGAPLIRILNDQAQDLVVADRNTGDIADLTLNSDIIISATGSPKIIKPGMVNPGAVLIDAGTAEVSGELLGDIDPKLYEIASYYTPVPGGIGPVTVAMLMKNLVSKQTASK